MGRKKIKITRISDDRNRSVTYLKRKAGLMKKAHELAVLTGSEVAVIVFGQNGKLTEFCSGDMDRVLLRYTEHTGPIERKGPEHYSNDDDGDASDDDGEGGDADDGGEGYGDDAESGGGAAGAGGSGSRLESNAVGSRSNGASDKQHQGKDGKNNKRKAPTGHKRKDGNSLSSEGSFKRGSPPNTAPIIKVEGQPEEPSSSTDFNGGVDKGALKAAIIQRSGSKPASRDGRPQSTISHHHSFSGSDMRSISASSSSQFNNGDASTSERPYTAGALMGMPTSAPAMFSPNYSNQQDSNPSSRFAYSVDTSNLQPQYNSASTSGYLQPQQAWGDNSGQSHMMSSNSAPSHSSQGLSYGELARGGINSPMDSSFRLQQQTNQAVESSPAHQQGQSSYASLQLPQQMHGGNPGAMLPLAHPILRQHPQYEAYANHLRMQQQQALGGRDMSFPNVGVHTAPSSPNHLAVGEHSGLMASGGDMDPSMGRRSASFGYVTQQTDRKNFQEAVGNQTFSFQSPFGGDDRRPDLSQGGRSFSSLSAPPPTSYVQADVSPSGMDTSGDLTNQQSSEASISNAAFNDLMGTILSDMGSSNSSVSGSVTNGNASDKNLKDSLKEQEDAIRSMESNGSLATLVNSESFDTLLAEGQQGDASKIVITTTDSRSQSADR